MDKDCIVQKVHFDKLVLNPCFLQGCVLVIHSILAYKVQFPDPLFCHPPKKAFCMQIKGRSRKNVQLSGRTTVGTDMPLTKLWVCLHPMPHFSHRCCNSMGEILTCLFLARAASLYELLCHNVFMCLYLYVTNFRRHLLMSYIVVWCS